MGFYPGLGSVNYGNALMQGLNNGATAIKDYNNDQRKRQQEDEDRLLKKQQADLQIGNLKLQQEQMKNQNEEYQATAQARELRRKIEMNELDERQGAFLDNVSEDWSLVASGQKDIASFNQKYKKNLTGLKQLDTGLFEAQDEGKVQYRIDHPKLRGRQDLAFSALVNEKLDGVPDDQKKAAYIAVNKALRGFPEGRAQVEQLGLSDLLDYDAQFDPAVKNSSSIAALNQKKWELQKIAATNGTDVSQQISQLDEQIKSANAGTGLELKNPIGGSQPAPVAQQQPAQPQNIDPNISQRYGNSISEFNQPIAANRKDGRGQKATEVQKQAYTKSMIEKASLIDLGKAIEKDVGKYQGRGANKSDPIKREIGPLVIARTQELLADNPSPSQTDITNASRQAINEIYPQYKAKKLEEKKNAYVAPGLGNMATARHR